jgi:hypothetical protein
VEFFHALHMSRGFLQYGFRGYGSLFRAQALFIAAAAHQTSLDLPGAFRLRLRLFKTGLRIRAIDLG